MTPEKAVFRGTAEACFHHFKKQFERRYPKGVKGTEKAKAPMADFCGVRVTAITRWFNSNEGASGSTYMKLLCFLQVQGYIINELQGLGTTELGLLELIGYDVVDPKEIQQYLKYPQLGQMFKVLRGEGKLVNSRASRGWEFLRKHRSALKEKKQALKKKPPYKFGATLGAPLQHRALLGAMEALTFMLLAEVPPHQKQDLLTRLGDAPSDLRAQLDDFMGRLKPKEE